MSKMVNKALRSGDPSKRAAAENGEIKEPLDRRKWGIWIGSTLALLALIAGVVFLATRPPAPLSLSETESVKVLTGLREKQLSYIQENPEEPPADGEVTYPGTFLTIQEDIPGILSAPTLSASPIFTATDRVEGGAVTLKEGVIGEAGVGTLVGGSEAGEPFENLEFLQVGNDIYVESLNRSFQYSVYNIRFVTGEASPEVVPGLDNGILVLRNSAGTVQIEASLVTWTPLPVEYLERSLDLYTGEDNS